MQDPAQLNDPIVYTLTATNTGNVTLSGVAITDSLLGAGITYTWPGTAGILLPGQSVTATGSHPVTQAEIDAGVATNTATASGQDPGGNPVPSGPASTTTPLAPGPHLTLDKTASPAFGTPAAVGDLITFGFTITNDGNLTLNTVAITDRLPGLSAIAYTWPGISGVLAPGQSATATATYPITQDDIDAGGVANTAISNGTTPGGADTPSNEDGTNTPIPQAPGIGLTKTADASGVQNPTVVGDPIVYHFTVTNTGNTSLTGVTITDQLAGLSALTYSWPGADGELSPQQSATATATYAVTQADIDNGQVVNSATATGDAPGGGTPQSPPVSTVTPTGAAAALSLVKSASPILASSYTAGQLITYTFVVTNTGNVLVSGIAITETAFSGTGVLGAATCDVTALAPTEQATCTAAYTLTQADVDSGQLSNTATASGTDPNQDPVDSNPSSVVIPSDPSPALTLLKTANLTSVTTAGQVITYTFTVTNTGNVTIAGITISETVFTGAGSAPAPTCPAEAASLAPGQSVDCTATYTDVDADLTGSPILNTATATGVPAGSDPLTTPPSTALVDTVVPEPPTPPEPPAPPVPDVSPLAKTGSTLPVLQFALGAMLILIGTVFTTRNRRRRGTR
ncbi:DUF7507 domain-containing protein [Leifsonia poae]|uniref:DUF7507 domain-containing protein n=1 Tax=Leifsonia poae TaxID=110933 RepID=UPI003D6795F5